MIARPVCTCVDSNDNVFHGDFFPDILHFSSPIRDIIELKCVVIPFVQHLHHIFEGFIVSQVAFLSICR